jgi:hypothetical protein
LNHRPRDYDSAGQQQIKMVACPRFEPAARGLMRPDGLTFGLDICR